MPRKSRADDDAARVVRLNLVGTGPPPPPEELTGEQAAEWVKITGALPVGFFSVEMFPLLSSLCRAICFARATSRWLDEHPASAIDAGDAEAMRKHRLVSGEYEQWSRQVASLSTKLRLSPQSRYHSGAMPSRFGRGADGGPRMSRKPWEVPSA